ncbi:MAG: hypothetical protein ACF8LL_05240 [Phycisphaerales bacterium]
MSALDRVTFERVAGSGPLSWLVDVEVQQQTVEAYKRATNEVAWEFFHEHEDAPLVTVRVLWRKHVVRVRDVRQMMVWLHGEEPVEDPHG